LKEKIIINHKNSLHIVKNNVYLTINKRKNMKNTRKVINEKLVPVFEEKGYSLFRLEEDIGDWTDIDEQDVEISISKEFPNCLVIRTYEKSEDDEN
jgi:hypothetical protein